MDVVVGVASSSGCGATSISSVDCAFAILGIIVDVGQLIIHMSCVNSR